jgi:kinetochore protein Mis12/MTW1
LLDDIINSINLLAELALNSIEEGLLKYPPEQIGFRPVQSKNATDSEGAQTLSADEARRHEVEAGTHQLETLLCAAIDRNFDVFELYVMRNILCLPASDRDWIRLGHYEGLEFKDKAGQDEASAADANTPTVDSVNWLRRRLQASQKLNCMMHAEKARNAALLREMRAAVGGPVAADDDLDPMVKEEDTAMDATGGEQGQKNQPPLAFLQNKGSLTEGDAETPLTTTTAFSLSQLQVLRSLSTSLRTILPDLNDIGGGQDDEQTNSDARKTWRRDRVEYVESATRRHLENVRGLELGRNGEVRDGEWQGQGRSLAKGEVEGLEKVMTVLGAAPSSSTAKDDVMDES